MEMEIQVIIILITCLNKKFYNKNKWQKKILKSDILLFIYLYLVNNIILNELN